uniref:ZSWIM4-8 C-terminal domain-containing protein n=1 Tax=Echinococcus canadensis TaxID=519352 RepID=A0A915EXV1_9CEST
MDLMLQNTSRDRRFHWHTCAARAPDPTAGGGINDSSTWYFDESGVQEQLRLNLAALAAYGVGGCNAFDIASSQTVSTSSSTTTSSSSSTYGRLFINNGHSDFHHCRFGRFSARYSTDEGPTTDENGYKPRNFAYRSFAHTWLENYRHLLRSKLPPFGYTTSASASTSNHSVHSSAHSIHHHTVNGSGGGGIGSGSSMQILLPSFTPLNMNTTAPHHFPGSQIAMVFAKTYELLAARDTNGPRLLAIITEELLNSANLMAFKSRRNNRSGGLADRGVWDPYAADFDEGPDDFDAQDAQNRHQRTGASTSQPPPLWTVPLWEEVARLWTCLLLAPGFSPATRDGWRERLLAWSQSPQAPRHEIYFFPSSYATNNPSPTEDGSAAPRGSREPTSVFQLALDVSALPLEISEEFPPISRNTLSELIRILPADSRQCTCPFCGVSMVIRRAWGAEEDFVTACLRASALHVMGFGEAATRLAVTLANTLIACLEDVSHRGAMLGEITSGPCSPTPSSLTSQPPSFVRSNSGGSGKAIGLNSSSGGSGNQSRGGFRSPPPPPPLQPQHFSPFQQRNHYPCTSAGMGLSSAATANTSASSYFHFSPPSPSAPCVFPYNHHYHYQQGRHRFSPWQRMPQRPDPSQYIYCSSEVSLDCPFHEHGWLGLPGRPVISLVECLLEAALQKLQDPSRSGLSPSEYIHLALKVGILVLCQQRSLPSTSGALLACQAQEMLLIHLLNTIPRNAMTAQIIGPLICQLMGPPPPSLHPMGTGTQGAWWWSALGPLVHPDTYPVHVVAELLFGHLLAGESAGAYTGELAYLVAARAMRLPVLEPVSDSPLVINATTTTTSTAHQHGDNSSPPSTYTVSAAISASGAFRSPPLPSTFFNAAMTPFARLPVLPLPLPPPQPLPNYHRQGQETRRHQHPAFVNQDSVATAYRRDLGAMEGRQARLAISLILASRSAVFRMDHFMRVCDRHIHTSISLLSVSREVLAEAIGHRLHSSTSAFSLDEPAFLFNTSAAAAAATATTTGISGSANTGASLTAGTTSAAGSLGFANLLPVNFVTTPLPTNALQERISLVCAAFHLALCVTVRTAWPRVHWRRREMLGWAVSTGLLAGPPALLHLTQAWSVYASPREAVTWLAPTLLACIACISPVGGAAGVGAGVSRGAGARPTRNSAEGMLFLLPRIYSFFSFTPLAVEQIKVAVRQMTIQHLKEAHLCAYSGDNCHHCSGICENVGEIDVVDQVYSGSKHEGTCSDAKEDEEDFAEPLWFYPACNSQEAPRPLRLGSRYVEIVVEKARNLFPLLAFLFGYTIVFLTYGVYQALVAFRLSTSLSFPPVIFANKDATGGGVVWLTADPFARFYYRPCPVRSTRYRPKIRRHSLSPQQESACLAKYQRSLDILETVHLLQTCVEPLTRRWPKFDASPQQRLANYSGAAAQDPVNCALTALQLTELDAASFEATYQLVVEAAKSGSLGPTHLFSAARHLDARGYPLWAFPLTVHAMRLFSLSGLQESHPVAHDVLWSCLLAHRIGLTALQEILSHVVRNVHCPTLLADILHRCRAPPPPSLPPLPTPQYHPHSHHHPNHHHRVDGNHVYAGYYPTSKQAQPPLLPVDSPPLKPLLEATISAFVATTHARLANISPRQYADFLDFLSRARDTFVLLKPDGPAQFRQLVSCLCHSYRGKRKLIALLNERFHHT